MGMFPSLPLADCSCTAFARSSCEGSLPPESQVLTGKAGNIMQYDHNRSLPTLSEQPRRLGPLRVANPASTISGSSYSGSTTRTEGGYANSGTFLR